MNIQKDKKLHYLLLFFIKACMLFIKFLLQIGIKIKHEHFPKSFSQCNFMKTSKHAYFFIASKSHSLKSIIIKYLIIHSSNTMAFGRKKFRKIIVCVKWAFVCIFVYNYSPCSLCCCLYRVSRHLW